MFKEITVTERVNLGTEEEPNWQNVKTYSYFDNNGKALAERLEEPAEYYSWDAEYNYELGTYEHFGYIKIDGKYNYFNKGEIFFVDDSLLAIRLPAEVGESPYKIGEFKGYSYYKTYNRIQVINTNTYKVVVDYTIPEPYLAQGSHVIDILANGNVYFYSWANNDEIFDSKYVDGSTYRLHNVIIDVTTGKATEVEVPFIVLDMLTPADGVVSGAKIKDECIYAEILPIVDGKIAYDVEFVILNSKLEKIATLPKFVENQISCDKMIGSGKFVFSAENLEYDTIQYLADGETNTVTPYWNGNYSYQIENGFVVVEDDTINGQYRYLVYNYNLKKVAEYTSEQSPSFDLGVIRFTDMVTAGASGDDPTADDAFINDYKPATTKEAVYKVAYINANGELKVNELSRDNAPTRLGYQDLWIVSKEVFEFGVETRIYVYNVYGECIKTIDNATDFSLVYNNNYGVLIGMATTANGTTYYTIK